MRRTCERPLRTCEIVLTQCRTRLDESLFIESDALVQPRRVWLRPHHEEQMPDRAHLGLPGLIVLPPNALQFSFPDQLHDLGMRMQRDVRCFLDSSDQV